LLTHPSDPEFTTVWKGSINASHFQSAIRGNSFRSVRKTLMKIIATEGEIKYIMGNFVRGTRHAAE
jgi:hypothetical protein